ncbi:MAG: septal ring lytic transglycosylase RlpA family protein [bacterium]
MKIFKIFFMFPLLFFIFSCTVPLHIDHPVARGDTYYLFATFYGDDYEGRKTASGDVFDPGKQTCAAKGFPLGTLLEITNIDNGKKTLVHVNDRPGENVIDLSKKAFSDIAEISEGRIRVRITVLGSSDSGDVRYEEKKSDVAGVDLVYTVELMSFSQFDAAAKYKEKFGSEQVYIFADHGSRDIYRVRAGAFKNRKEAEKFLSEKFPESENAEVISLEK